MSMEKNIFIGKKMREYITSTYMISSRNNDNGYTVLINSENK